MPVYSCFRSMDHLEEEIVKKTMDLILKHMLTPRSGDPWIDHGVGVVMFAVQEKHLFRSVFDEKHAAVRRKHSVRVWRAGAQSLSDYPPFKELSEHQVEMIRRARWIFTHGLASLMNTSNSAIQNEAQLIRTIERISWAIYNEFK